MRFIRLLLMAVIAGVGNQAAAQWYPVYPPYPFYPPRFIWGMPPVPIPSYPPPVILRRFVPPPGNDSSAAQPIYLIAFKGNVTCWAAAYWASNNIFYYVTRNGQQR